MNHIKMSKLERKVSQRSLSKVEEELAPHSGCSLLVHKLSWFFRTNLYCFALSALLIAWAALMTLPTLGNTLQELAGDTYNGKTAKDVEIYTAAYFIFEALVVSRDEVRERGGEWHLTHNIC